MTDDPMLYVAQIAKGIATKAMCHYRPVTVRAITVQRISSGAVVVWIVTDGLPGWKVTQNGVGAPVPASYRFTFQRVDSWPRPQMSTEHLAVVSAGGVRECTYWDIPGNVRDLGITAGQRALGLSTWRGAFP